MKITVKLYDGNDGSDLINMEIYSGSLDIINYFIKHLEPEQEGLYIKFNDIQFNISLGYVGYFTEYAVNVAEGEYIDHSFGFETASEAWELVREYLDNAIDTERAVQAWD